ncbi:MAG: heparinase II/III-family protein [Candidatus Pacebacteria bacterium]|nr:heparinase II/III-family protein [Candidatus Paceibacterota bacterium]
MKENSDRLRQATQGRFGVGPWVERSDADIEALVRWSPPNVPGIVAGAPPEFGKLDFAERQPFRMTAKKTGTVFFERPEDYPPDYLFPENKHLVVTGLDGTQFEVSYFEHEGVKYSPALAIWRQRLHKYGFLVNFLRSCAEAYAITGEERYARPALLVLNRLGDLFPRLPLYDGGAQVNEPCWVTEADGKTPLTMATYRAAPRALRLTGDYPSWVRVKCCPGTQFAQYHFYLVDYLGRLLGSYSLLRNSPTVEALGREKYDDAAAVRRNIEDRMFREVLDICRLYPAEIGNHSGSWRTGALRAAMMFDDQALIDFCIDHLRFEVRNCHYYDGMYQDGSIAYSHMSRRNIVNDTEFLYRMGIDLYRRLPVLESVIVNWIYAVPSNFVEPALDDCPAHPQGRNVFSLMRSRLGLVAKRFGNPEYSRQIETMDALKDGGERGRFFKSRNFPGVGWAVLRAGKGDDLTEIFLDYSHAHGHNQCDIGSIDLFFRGHEILCDPGYGKGGLKEMEEKYNFPAHWLDHAWLRNFYGRTGSHNVIQINNLSQQPGETAQPFGNLLLYQDKAGNDDAPMQMVAADLRKAYPESAYGFGLNRFERALLLVDMPDGGAYAVDHAAVDGGRVHDWMVKTRGELESVSDSLTFGEPHGTLLGYLNPECGEFGDIWPLEPRFALITEPGKPLTESYMREWCNKLPQGNGFGFIEEARVAEEAHEPFEMVWRDGEHWARLLSPRRKDTDGFVAVGKALGWVSLGTPSRRMFSQIVVRNEHAAAPLRSNFVYVYENRYGASAPSWGIRRATDLLANGDATREESLAAALRIDFTDAAHGPDILIDNPEADSLNVAGPAGPVRFDGRALLLRHAAVGGLDALHMVGPGRVDAGAMSVALDRAHPVRLVEAVGDVSGDDRARALLVETQAALPLGDTLSGTHLTIRHADDTTFGYQIAAVRRAMTPHRYWIQLAGTPSLPLRRDKVTAVDRDRVRIHATAAAIGSNYFPGKWMRLQGKDVALKITRCLAARPGHRDVYEIEFNDETRPLFDRVAVGDEFAVTGLTEGQEVAIPEVFTLIRHGDRYRIRTTTDGELCFRHATVTIQDPAGDVLTELAPGRTWRFRVAEFPNGVLLVIGPGADGAAH